MRRPHAGGHREQVQVVVAEQEARRVAQRMQALEHAQAVGAAVDEVAQHVQAVARRREADLGEQAIEGVAAALQVADQKVHGPILLRSRPLAATGAPPPLRADRMDVALLVFLILLNALFAMSEMALTAGAQGAAGGDGRGRRSGCAGRDGAARPAHALAVDGAGRHHLDRHPERHRRRRRVLGAAVGLAAWRDRRAAAGGRRSAPPRWW